MRGRALRVLVGGLAAVGSAVLAAAWLAAAEGPSVGASWSALALLLLVFGELRLMSARVGSQQVSVALDELAAVLALALIPGPWVVLLGGAAAAGMQLVRRKPPVKAVFATALTVIGLGVAWGLAGALPTLRQPGVTLSTDLRLVLAAFAYGLVTLAFTAVAVSFAQGRAVREVLRTIGAFHALVAAVNAATGLAILVLAQWAPAAMVVVPPMVLALALTYSLYLRADREREAWQLLESASADMISLSVHSVARQAILHAVRLFHADGAEIALVPGAVPDGGSWSTDDRGDVRESATSSGWLAMSLPHQTGSRATSVVVSDGGEQRSGVVCDLLGPGGNVGRLALTFVGPVRLGARDRRILGTYTRTVSAALERAALHEQVRDQCERKAYEAAHDPLTGLANRSLLQERVREALSEPPAGGRICGLLVLDLDHFKTVNDTLGHSTGDRLLRTVSQRLETVVGTKDLVARLGGDEFAVLLPGLTDPAAAEGVAASVLAVLATPIDLDGLRLAVGGSIGIACCPGDAADAEELFQRADVALYQAKESRGAARRYRSDRDSSSVSRLELVAELTAALDRDQIVLHYQPQVDVGVGSLTGVEALARWQHPTRGLLMPGDFLAAVEHSGLLQAFTLRVLDTAVRDCSSWLREGRSLNVAVNLSARDLLDRRLPLDVADVLTRHGLPAEALVLEITETAMVGELDVVEEVLGQLRALGVQLSVDDFGTGYSSLSFLQRVRVNELKVDQSFVAGLLTDEADAALVRATIELAHSFGLRAVAEGVESEVLLDALRGLGCDVVQGWYVGRAADLVTTRRRLGLPPLAPAHRLPPPRVPLPRVPRTSAPRAASR